MPQGNVGIYSIRNDHTGDYYVGSSNNIRRRWSVHKSYLRQGKHHSPILQRAWNKYGEDAFVFGVVEECPTDDLMEREQEYLTYQKGKYNIAGETEHTTRGLKWTTEQRQHLSDVMTGRPKLTLRGRKRTFTPEWREHIRQAKLGKPGPHTQPHSEETKARISAAKMGNTCAAGKRTPEQCERIRQGQLARKRTRAEQLLADYA